MQNGPTWVLSPISPPSYGPKMQRKYSPNKKAHYILDTETGDIEWEQKSKSSTKSSEIGIIISFSL